MTPTVAGYTRREPTLETLMHCDFCGRSEVTPILNRDEAGPIPDALTMYQSDRDGLTECIDCVEAPR